MPSLTRDARYPWLLIGLLWMVAFLNAADRSILVAVMPRLREEFGLSNTQLALVNSVFFWIYAGFALISGRIGDSVRRSHLIMAGLVFWSISTGLMPLSVGFASLLALRALVAAGESTYYPTATALISSWHRPEMRSRALSLHQTAVFAGGGLGALVAGSIADIYGWRAPFLVFAVGGVAVAVVLWFLLKDPPAAPTSLDSRGATSPFKTVFANPSALLLCVVFFLASSANNSLMVWAPTFVYDRMGTNLAGAAVVGSMTINIAGFLSVPVGGWLADTLARRHPAGRFHTLIVGLAVAALCLAPLPLASTIGMVAAMLVASSVGKGLFDGCIYSAMHDLVAPHARGTAVGLMTTFGFVGAGIFPIVVAQISQHFGMGAGLGSLALLYVCAAILLLVGQQRITAAVRANAT